MLTAVTAAHGPSGTATSTPPTAWAVVPSGMCTGETSLGSNLDVVAAVATRR
jgi:hypothetical protein